MAVLSGIEGSALCYPAFSLVVLLRKSYQGWGEPLSAAERPAVRRWVWPWSPSRPSMAINLPWTRWTEDAIEVKHLEEPVGADRRRWRGSALAIGDGLTPRELGA